MFQLDLQIGVQSVQLFLRQVIDRAPQWLFTVEELDSQVSQTGARYRL
jgi:hypothetical protein